jgi:hypothetical protein
MATILDLINGPSDKVQIGDIDKEWVNAIQSMYDRHPIKTKKHPKMQLSYSFYRGEQYKKWDEAAGMLVDVTLTRETKSMYNFCKVFGDLYPAKMLKDDPVPYGTPFPDNTESNDERVTLVSNAAFRWWWKRMGMRQKTFSVVKYGGIMGLGVLKTYWDKTFGKEIGDEIVTDDYGQPIAVRKIFAGEVVTKVINPVRFYPDPDAVCPEEMQWAFDVAPYPISFLEATYGVKDLAQDDKSKLNNYRSDTTNSVDDYTTNTEEPVALLYDFWAKATPLNPNGCHVMVAGGKILIPVEANPEPDILPYDLVAVSKPMDELIGGGVIYPLYTLQRDFNKSNSLIQESIRWMGNQKWFVHEDTNIEDNALNDESGEIVRWGGQVMPSIVGAQPLPQHILERPNYLMELAKFITKMQDAGMGIMGKRFSQTSGAAIDSLKSSEEISFTEDIANVDLFFANVYLRYCRLAKKYYQEERIAYIVGKDKKQEVVRFMGTDFVDNYDVNTEIGLGFAPSDKSKFDQYLQLVQTGFFEKAGIPLDFVAKEVLKIGGMNKLSEITYMDERQARRLLDTILRGGNPVFSKYSNVDLFIKIFQQFTTGAEYENALNDQQRLAIDVNIEKFKQIQLQLAVQKMIEEMQKMQAVQQAVPPPQPPAPMALQGKYPGQGAPGANPEMPQTVTQRDEAQNNLHLASGQPSQNG